MSEPRYSPRDFCLDPDFFGKEGVRWLPTPTERSEALGRAARLQHLYALRIRARAKQIALENRAKMRSDPGTDPDTDLAKPPLQTLAEKMGLSYPRVLRCLRGEVVMRLDDIAWADVVLGEISEVAHLQAAKARADQARKDALRGVRTPPGL